MEDMREYYLNQESPHIRGARIEILLLPIYQHWHGRRLTYVERGLKYI